MKKYWKVFLLVAIFSAAAACVTFLFIKKAYDKKNNTENVGTNTETGIFAAKKETLNLWYTDESLADYLASVTVDYNTKHKDVRIVPKLVSAKDYVSSISDASVKGTDMPDLFIISNDTLEQDTLGGLTSEVPSDKAGYISGKVPEIAMNAVTYDGKVVGYPLYYETSSLLYNKTYLDEWAKSQVEAEEDAKEGEAAQAADETDAARTQSVETSTATETSSAAQTERASKNTTEAATETVTESATQTATETAVSADIQKRIDDKEADILPKKITDIETFADTYDAPETMQAIFKWDVTDIFYNYFFIGASVNIGGKDGDDDTIDLYNSNSVKSMELYQNLNQFFSIDTSEISYKQIIQDFIDGKILYTVATTDAVASIDRAKEEGKCSYDYGITLLPDISEELPAKSLSVTSAVVVNGYCADKDAANEFASYLALLPPQEFYDRTGRVSVLKEDKYDEPALGEFMNEYERSAPISKTLSTGSSWLQLEIAFSKIWDGADPNDTLHELSEKVITSATGKEYKQDKIEVEGETSETSETLETNEFVDDSETKETSSETTNGDAAGSTSAKTSGGQN